MGAALGEGFASRGMRGPRPDWAGCMPWAGGPRDDAKSFVWYEKAAKNGYAGGAADAGEIL